MAELNLSSGDITAIAQQIAERLATCAEVATPTSPQKLLWTEQEAALALGISSDTLKKWRGRGYVKSHTTTKPILYTWQQIEAIANWMPNRNTED